MDFLSTLKQYWPFLLLALWIGHKWWNARKVAGLLPELKQRGATLVDVRSVAEYASGHAPGTINIPLQELGSRLGEIPRSNPVVVACASGSRSGMAKLLLKKNGYADVHNLGSWRNFGG